MYQVLKCQVRTSGQNSATGYDSICKTSVSLLFSYFTICQNMTNFVMKLSLKPKADEVFIQIYSHRSKPNLEDARK